eukprot:CAMPEP_0194371190 /NCGR_PEP_ID=MMETSP0174-20130528/19578_1 /TAXON_ID=216777 /ORGANISM="Proboscia alata, Strain PI-D3" /LENGTH=152 /DNA_ID=CAMNT_0039149105 /DNA_START=105 /DNA_END=563 /DNA_ORIENTATION=-
MKLHFSYIVLTLTLGLSQAQYFQQSSEYTYMVNTLATAEKVQINEQNQAINLMLGSMKTFKINEEQDSKKMYIKRGSSFFADGKTEVVEGGYVALSSRPKSSKVGSCQADPICEPTVDYAEISTMESTLGVGVGGKFDRAHPLGNPGGRGVF